MRIAMFAMGGTIAMRRQRNGGVAPQDDAEALFASMDLAADITVERHDLLLKPSASVDLADVANLARAIEDAAARGVDGVVVTHGTDTLEETAFALGLMCSTQIPVVVTGAMRSADSIGADGPANLDGAIRVAAHSGAHRHGILVVIGDEIHAAHLLRKVHSGRPHAFSSAPFGPIGQIMEGKVVFEMASLAKLPRLALGKVIPVVPILQAGMDLEPETLHALKTPTIHGLILAGAGGGHISARTVPALDELLREKPVVITSRVDMGPTLRQSYAYAGGDIDLLRRGVINGGRWRPVQARIIMQLALSSGALLPACF